MSAWRRAGGTGGTSGRARRCSGESRAVQKASVAASLDAEGSYRSDEGAVWREVSYSLRETQAPSPTSDYREGRAKVSPRSTRSSSAFSRWTGRSAPFPLRAASSVWNCWARRTCLKVPAQDHPELRLRCSTARISAACPRRGGLVVGGHAGGPVPSAPRPGRAMTSGSTRAR